jgi:hypothetical protein
MDANKRPSYMSDLFAMLGTLFLFIYWPSFKYASSPLGDSVVIHLPFAVISKGDPFL